MRNILLASAVSAALGFAVPAHALLITGSGTVNGQSASASADFEIVGNTLTITLTNTSPEASPGTDAPANTLTGIEFSFQNTRLNLTPVSAISTKAIFNAADCNVTACGGTNVNVGGEFGLDDGTTAGITGNAIASSGYITTPGGAGNFNGPVLEDPTALDGIDFGIITAKDKSSDLNPKLQAVALIQDTVVLTLNGVGGDLANPGNLTSVTFLYGTSLGEGSLTGTCSGGSCIIIPGGGGASSPEPATVGIFGTALLGLAAARRRKRSN